MRWRGLRFDDEERVWKWLSSELLNPILAWDGDGQQGLPGARRMVVPEYTL